MKPILAAFIVLSAFGVGAIGGSYVATQRAKTAVLANPYSDSLLPARYELTTAMSKLREGDTNIAEHIQRAEQHGKDAEAWCLRFVGLNGNPNPETKLNQMLPPTDHSVTRYRPLLIQAGPNAFANASAMTR